MDLENYLYSVTQDLKDLFKQLNQAVWNLETTGTDEAAKEHQLLDLRYKQYFNDPVKYTYLKTFENNDISPVLARQVNVLLRTFRSHLMPEEILTKISQKESDLMRKYVSFRPTINNIEYSENQIRDILSKEKDPNIRKQAYEASKQIGAVLAPIIIDLVKLRNKGAQSLGFPNFFRMQLELQEVDENWLIKTFEELYRDTDQEYQRILQEIEQQLCHKFNVPREELGPWAWSEPFGQEDPLDTEELNKIIQDVDFIDAAKLFFKNLGFFDVTSVIEKSDLYERKGKNQHAFCIHIDREGDIRTLNNLKPSMRWLETLLHEVGHAVYEQGFQQSTPWILKEPPHMITTEAMALICGRQPYLPMFWKGKNIDSTLLNKAKSSLKRRQLIFSRWVMVMTFFEKGLYENPDQNLNALWWNLVKKYQHISVSEDRSAKFDWASKYHIGLAPVYYFSYLLGEMFASQIEKTLYQHNGQGFLSDQSASFLNKHLFGPANQYPWYQLIEQVTGSSLSSKAWIEEFT